MKRKEWKEAIHLGLDLLCDKVEGFGYTQKRVAQKLRVLGFDVSLPFISKVRAFVSPDYIPRSGGNVGDDFLRKTAKYVQELLYLERGYEFNRTSLTYNKTTDEQWERHEVKEEEGLSEVTNATADQLVFHAGGRWSHEAKIEFMNLAQHEIIEFGLRLRAFRDYMKTTGDDVFYEPIKALLKRGVDFKCYMLDPNSNIAHLYFSDLSKASVTEKRSPEIMRQVIADIKEFAREFQQDDLEGAFILHTYNHIPHNHFYIIDKDYPNARILISHYVYGLARGKAPVIQFSKKSHPTLFRRYLQSFHVLANDAKIVASSHQTQLLMAKRALIEFFLIESVLYTFLIRPDDPDLGIMDKEPILLEVEVSEQEVDQLVVDLRQEIYGALTGSAYEGADAWQSFQSLGQKIFSAKLMNLVAPYESLYIVPYGALHYLPLHAIKVEDQYLIERFQIAYLPSSSVLGYLRKGVEEGQGSDKTSILVGGVDYTGEYGEFALEAEQIWALEGWDRAKSQCLTRKALNKRAFFEHCYDKKVIHLSSHGYFSEEDPMHSGTLLAGEYSSEFNEKRKVSSQDRDYILMAEDFFQLKQPLQADLFVMSACVTGESINRAGDELIGLTRGLMYAGVNTMIVSLFPTIKNVTANRQDEGLRFARFYEFWLHEGQTKGQAFQSYIKGLIRNPTFQHPMYWSPFILVGKFN